MAASRLEEEGAAFLTSLSTNGLWIMFKPGPGEEIGQSYALHLDRTTLSLYLLGSATLGAIKVPP